jgi:hypothetical protein
MKATAMLSFVLLACLCGSAVAGCDLSGFDHTPPPAIKSQVDNQFAQFEWASDADTRSGQQWVWHYIRNKGTKGLGVRWPKAGIRQPLTRPLPPGEANCNEFPIDALAAKPDTDAPIIYGTNEQRQPAAIFIADNGSQKKAGAKIQSSYLNDEGKVVPVNVEVSMGATKSGFYFVVTHTPGLVIAMSGISKVFSQTQFEIMSSTYKEQRVSIAAMTFADYTKQDPKRLLAGMFSAEEIGEVSDQPYVFFRGNPKASVELPADSFRTVMSNMIVLDEALRPILATQVRLLVPGKQ